MNALDIKIKLSCIPGLESVVLTELKEGNFELINHNNDSIFLRFSDGLMGDIKKLRSVSRVYLVSQNKLYNPSYVASHKSVLNNLIDIVLSDDNFKSFKITCAGSGSPEIRDIIKYIKNTYKIHESEEADLKIHIIKSDDIWEIGVQITPRPLSVRDYRVVNMSGAMDPTIAYAVNRFADLSSVKSYLNIFSGSATLLIEAGLCYKNLESLVGFDNNKKHLSLSIQNIKKAGLIKRIKIKEADIFDYPKLGKFDVIVSDLPFGMVISKGQDLESLYRVFVEYSKSILNEKGKLVVYTNEYELFEKIINESNFEVISFVQLKIITNANAYLRPKIFVCGLK